MDLPRQSDNHIVLRLARDTGIKSSDSWQVLSLSCCGAFCEFDQTTRTDRHKKVTRQKRQISVTVRKPGVAAKRRNKGKSKQKGKKLTGTATVLNDIIVSECADSNDVGQVIRRRDLKQTNVLAAECCDFCGSSNARKRGSVPRRSRTTRLLDKDSHALKENFFEASDNGNTNTTNNVTTSLLDTGNITAVHFDNVNCTNARSNISQTSLAQDEDGHQRVDNCQESGVYNGRFGLADDSVNVRKRRKVMPKLEPIKHHCHVEEGLSESKDKLDQMEAAEKVDGAHACESDGLADDSVKVRKRGKVMPKSEPIKHRCHVEERLSESKDKLEQMEAAEKVDGARVRKSDNVNTDVIGGSVLVSRRSRPVKNMRLMNNCYIFSPTVKTRRRKKAGGKQLAAETALNPNCATTESSETGSSQMESISDPVTATQHAVVGNDKFNCHIPAGEETSQNSTLNKSCSEAEYAEPSSASNLPVLNLLDDFKEDTAQNDVSENLCAHRSNADISDTVSETVHEEIGIKVAEIEESSCTLPDDCKCDRQNHDTAVKEDFSTAESNTPPLDCMHSCMKDDSIDNQQLSSPSDNICCDLDQLSRTDEVTVTIESSETLKTESVLSGTVNSDYCEIDDSNDVVEIQPRDNSISFEFSDGLSCTADLNDNTAANMDSCQSMMDASELESSELRTSTALDCLLPDSADDIGVCIDMHKNMTNLTAVMADITSVDCEMPEFVTDDTGASASCNDVDDTNDVQLLSEAACSNATEIVETLMSDKQGSVTDKASACLPLPEPEFLTAYDVKLGKNTDEIDDMVPAVAAASSCGVTDSDCRNLHSDVVTASEAACSKSTEIVETLMSDKQGSVTDKVSACLPLPEPDFLTAYDVKLGKNTGEIDEMVPAVAAASSCGVTDSDCRILHFDVVTAASDNSQSVNLSIQPAAISIAATSKSTLPVRRTPTSHHHHRSSTHRSHRSRRKSVGQNVAGDINDKSAESSVDSLNGRVCSEETCEQLTVDDRLTDDQHRVRQKSTGSDTVEEIHAADAESRSDVAARKKRQHASSRLSCFLLLLLAAAAVVVVVVVVVLVLIIILKLLVYIVFRWLSAQRCCVQKKIAKHKGRMSKYVDITTFLLSTPALTTTIIDKITIYSNYANKTQLSI